MSIAIIGTDTGVGKTWVACAIAAELLRMGYSVVARKPVQSFDEGDSDPTDAKRLASATHELSELVCSPIWSFPLPMAPPMAADILGRPKLYLSDLTAWISRSLKDSTSQFSLVELVGGVCSPQTHDGDGLDLLRLLNPTHIVLVAPSGLGSINAVRLTMRALRDDMNVAVRPIVCLNRFSAENDLHQRNLNWLCDRDGYDAVGITRQGLSDLVLRLTRSPTG